MDKALLDTDIFSEILKGIIALRHSLTLVTGNISHYERIQKLGYDVRLENWRNSLSQ
ncbi:MAG: hypothetical protein HOC74_08800 [Gemmatimonadetes bacterium]|nr:hypothetical protein [Gemmatimonadota bacterium]